MRRKKHGGSHENHERWLLTYADMITLLVAFFIMLYAMSVTSKAKFEVLALSVRSGFNGNQRLQSVPLTPGTGIMTSNAMVAPIHDPMLEHPVGPLGIPKLGAPPQPLPENASSVNPAEIAKAQAEQEMMDKIQKEIQQEAKQHGLDSSLKVSQNVRGLTIRILTDKLLFAKGDAHLQPKADPLLTFIASAIKKVPNDISVEGHTDDLAINTPQYPSNWELSTARATNVLRYMLNHQVSDMRISASGYAYTRPLLPNTSEANRSRNRRVDIVIIRRYQMPGAMSE
jgi:chemotaxis protein MotB